MCCYMLFWLKYMKKFSLIGSAGKGISILLAFSCNCQYSFHWYYTQTWWVVLFKSQLYCGIWNHLGECFLCSVIGLPCIFSIYPGIVLSGRARFLSVEEVFRVNNHSSLPRIAILLARKVLHTRKTLSPGQTKTVVPLTN